MAGMCCELVGESEQSTVKSPSRAARRRRLEVRRLKVVASDAAVQLPEREIKRQKVDLPQQQEHDHSPATAVARDFFNAVDSSPAAPPNRSPDSCLLPAAEPSSSEESVSGGGGARFGVSSVRGRRKDMEDAVSVQAAFCGVDEENNPRGSDFYGVFDGHGCSHVSMKCKERMHEIVKEEIEKEGCGLTDQWKVAMERSFSRMDREVVETTAGVVVNCCKCELRTPQCDAVGSTAVLAIVTPDKIVVPNCGDSRAVLCRNGVAIALSSDHKPDRPDELQRIEAAGGRVIYWDGARVLGMLAMSRAIGDNYLKPYVVSEPEVTVMERSADDECLILASDGLWDVVSNDTACSVARTCLNARRPPSPGPLSHGSDETPPTVSDEAEMSSDKACLDASILLTKLALARYSSDNVSVVVVDLRRRRRL